MTTGTDVRAWIHSFRHLVKLTVCTFGWKDDRVSFILFRGLSPTLKSLSLYCSSAPFPEIFNLISSFPLLGDLELKRGDRWRNIDGRDIPSIPSKPTASSDLEGDYRPIGRGPLCLPDRSRLSRIIISRPVEDAKTVMDLVSKCSDTLESLCVEYVPFGAFPSAWLPRSINTLPLPVVKVETGSECHIPSISPGPQSSKMWSSWLGTPVFNGSPRRSKPPYPNPFGRFQFTHTEPASWLGKRGGNGRTLTASWSNCGLHILYFRRSCAVTGCKCPHQTCCRNSRVGGSAPSLEVTGRNKDDDDPKVVHLPYVNIFLGFLPPLYLR